MNFMRSKASPLADNILVTWFGSDYRGSNVDRSNLMYWVKKNTPMTGQDFYEVYNEFGLTGLPLGIPGIVGMGVQPRDLPRWAELDKYYSYSGKPNAKALRKQFRKDPMNEAKLFLRGNITAPQFPALVKYHVQALMRELNLKREDMPNVDAYDNLMAFPHKIPDILRDTGE